jgi:hypothetical protein
MLKSQEGDIVYIVCKKPEDSVTLGYTIESIHQTREGAVRACDRERSLPFNRKYRIWVNSFFLKV